MITLNKDFSVSNLMMALAISGVIILGASYSYSMAVDTIRETQNTEHHQEVLQTSSKLYTRALRQVIEKPEIINDNTLVITHEDKGVVGCNGMRYDTIFTETYTLQDEDVICQIDSTPPVVVIEGVDDIRYSMNDNLIEILIKPKNWRHESMPDGFQLDISMTNRILSNAR